jgi:Leucine-rich repeat (LRR) protein
MHEHGEGAEIGHLTRPGRVSLPNRGITRLGEIAICFGLRSARELDLSRNHITSTEGFSGMTELRVLDLSGNRIDDLSGLEDLPDLRVLKLARNSIRHVGAHLDLPQLRILDLSWNHIRSFSGGTTLPNLRILDLSYNGLKTIAGIASFGLLHEIYLHGNNLVRIDGLDQLSFLRELEVDSVAIAAPLAERLGKVNKIKTLESQEFLHFFSTCPVCGKENHDTSLAEFFFSSAPADRAIKDKLLAAIDTNGEARGTRIGIPCCECYERIRDG